jgi:hypothetical protein
MRNTPEATCADDNGGLLAPLLRAMQTSGGATQAPARARRRCETSSQPPALGSDAVDFIHVSKRISERRSA